MNFLKKLFTKNEQSQQQNKSKEIGKDYIEDPIAMVFVKGGKFQATLGSTDEYGRETVIKKAVSINNFYIGQYPVTQAQWNLVMGEHPEHTEKDNFPVTNVSWEEVQVFIGKLNKKTGKKYRLPSAQEWEYAATGGNESKGYKYSGSNDADKVAWYGENSNYNTHEVGTKQANELGIYDMSGNVWEWCNDRWGNYDKLSTFKGKEAFNILRSVLTATGNHKALAELDKEEAKTKNIADGAYRVRRGCSCLTMVEPYVNDSIRFTEVSDASYNDTGFRLAL
ncbi:MAG: formylglycine-generating enzyme family protein [Prevotellaceae bacterium]|jgi:formylglycine-generating enzyme required for sulfatase activity|nr:formylglycine-generating enzyme family protein [Prevotellaceae bacterium]